MAYAYTVPTSEPSVIVAGQTLKWEKSLSEYPASDGWTLTYEFRGAGSFTVTATTSSDGADYDIEVAKATTDSYPAGDYWWDAYVDDGTERWKVASGRAQVVEDLADVNAPHDGRSFAAQMVDALEATMLGKASQDQMSMKVGDRELGRMSWQQLLQARAQFRAELAQEKAAERAALGLDAQTAVNVRFHRT